MASYEFDDRETVEQALNTAQAAFQIWRDMTCDERAVHLVSVANELRAGKTRFARLITTEMGKPIVESEAEIEKCAWACEYFAKEAEGFLAERNLPSSATDSSVVFEPLGTLLGIMPWNYPFWQVFRYAAPALMAGNVTILKHAANVPGCARSVEQVFRDAGVPRGVLQSLLIENHVASELIDDDRIHCVTLTGSEGAGVSVAERSGRNLKKVVLELGGTDPFIVLADADLGEAVKTAVNARYQNTGQSCIAAKRIILDSEIADEFTEQFVGAVTSLKTGDPLDRDTKVGPVAREDLLKGLEMQIHESANKGATILVGGSRGDTPGFFLEPTVLSDVCPGMPAFDEELFGPVASLIRVQGSDEAVTMANRSRFGLGAAVWTGDVAGGRLLARRLEAGSVFVNGMVASDPRLPMGGIKRSGFGRELGEYGIREFTNVKTVWVGPRRD